MEFPKSVLDIVHRCASMDCDDERAIEEAKKLVRKLPEYDEFLDMLFTAEVEELVYEDLSTKNRKN
jgi:hypothetical protein